MSGSVYVSALQQGGIKNSNSVNLAYELLATGAVDVSVGINRSAGKLVIEVFDPFARSMSACNDELCSTPPSSMGRIGLSEPLSGSNRDVGPWSVRSTESGGEHTYRTRISAIAARQHFGDAMTENGQHWTGCAVSWGSVRVAVHACLCDGESPDVSEASSEFVVNDGRRETAGGFDLSARVVATELAGDGTALLVIETTSRNASAGVPNCKGGQDHRSVQIDPMDGISASCSDLVRPDGNGATSDCGYPVSPASFAGREIPLKFGSAKRINWCHSFGPGAGGCAECLQTWVIAVNATDGRTVRETGAVGARGDRHPGDHGALTAGCRPHAVFSEPASVARTGGRSVALPSFNTIGIAMWARVTSIVGRGRRTLDGVIVGDDTRGTSFGIGVAAPLIATDNTKRSAAPRVVASVVIDGMSVQNLGSRGNRQQQEQQQPQDVVLLSGKYTCVVASIEGAVDSSSVISVTSARVEIECPQVHVPGACSGFNRSLLHHESVVESKRQLDGVQVCFIAPNSGKSTIKIEWTATPNREPGVGNRHGHIPYDWCTDGDPTTPCNGTIIIDTHVACNYDDVYDPDFGGCVSSTERQIFAVLGVAFVVCLVIGIIVALSSALV